MRETYIIFMIIYKENTCVKCQEWPFKAIQYEHEFPTVIR
jgi:hypothetical protein